MGAWMTEPRAASARRDERRAAEWLARLNRPVVAQDDLAAFRRWREDPGNDAAYHDLQLLWRRSGALSADPDIRAALAETARPKTRPYAVRPRWMLAGPVTAAALLLVIGGATFASRPDTYVTSVGERSTIRLADGSTVQLDTDSRLEARWSRGARRLRLVRGQALFDVAHDAARPFVVAAGSLQVTATGTRFDVRREAGGGKVTLLQGRVVVRASETSKATWTLTPGQEAASGPRPTPPRPADPELATGWTTGRLTFRDTSLEDALAEANRYSRVQMRLQPDARLAAVRVDGVFTAGDSAALAQALGDLYDLKTDRQANGDLVLSRRA